MSFELLDYRVAAEKWKGEFDKVVSIEMIEAVGVEYLPTYFRALRDLVKPSGSIMVQAISMVEARYRDYCTSTGESRAANLLGIAGRLAVLEVCPHLRV